MWHVGAVDGAMNFTMVENQLSLSNRNECVNLINRYQAKAPFRRIKIKSHSTHIKYDFVQVTPGNSGKLESSTRMGLA